MKFNNEEMQAVWDTLQAMDQDKRESIGLALFEQRELYHRGHFNKEDVEQYTNETISDETWEWFIHKAKHGFMEQSEVVDAWELFKDLYPDLV